MDAEHEDMAAGLRLAGVAVVSAIVTAALVIGVGGAVLSDRGETADPAVVRVSAQARPIEA